jgi:hypothetical protein
MIVARRTPGPWKKTPGQTSIRITGADGYAVAAVRAKYPRTPDHRAIRDANASLIVAAPELLEALKALIEHLSKEKPGIRFQVAEAAIAKAEDRS